MTAKLSKIVKSQLPPNLKQKPEIVKDEFISVVNACIDKGMNYSMSFSEGNKAILALENKLRLQQE